MSRNQLAAELRHRLSVENTDPDDPSEIVPDDVILDCYIICSFCHARYFNEEGLARAIENARSTDEFLAICKQAARLHKHSH